MRRMIFVVAGLALVTVGSAQAYTVLGTGTGALLGGDRTDPENDGLDVPETATGNGLFNATFWANDKPTFSGPVGGGPNEAAFDVFDNKLGGGEAKWCCAGPIRWVAAEFDSPFGLTHFTIASGNDSPGRRPDVWSIQGSNDSTNGADGTWVDILAYDNNDLGAPSNRNTDNGASPFTAHNQALLFESVLGPNSPPAGVADFGLQHDGYTWFRYYVSSTAGWPGTGGEHQLAEIELFGLYDIPEPATLGLLFAGVAALGGYARRRRT